MNDTSHWAEAKLMELWQARRGGERLAIACAMFDSARRLLVAGIRSREPLISSSELRLRIFQLTYANDFTPAVWRRLEGQFRAREAGSAGPAENK